MAQLELKVWGPAEVVWQQVPLALPTRKLAALLAYLAVQGPTSRTQLAGLLWEQPERAKANLRGELYRLRKTKLAGAILEKNGQVWLEGFSTDLLAFAHQAQQGQWGEALGLRRGMFLEGMELEQAPGFEEWLQLTREAWEERFNQLLYRQAQRLIPGQPQQAVQAFAQLLQRDPLHEAAWREYMRLLHSLGESAKALEQYARYSQFLEKDLAVAPSKETRLLAESIRTGQAVKPVAVAVPLLGREGAWQTLQRAWQGGQLALVQGEAGIGKSRLLQEFATSKGHSQGWVWGRPEDGRVPFSSLSRFLRQHLKHHPISAPWVERELSRLLPELGHSLPPLQSPEDRLRLLSAVASFVGEGFCGVDDLQFVDSASLEAVFYLSQHLEGRPLWMAYRPGELGPEASAWIQAQIAAGRATVLELQPLSPSALAQWLQHLGLVPQPWLEGLHSQTGGNPLFVDETLNHLREQGLLEGSQPPKAWPRSQKVQAVILGRLERLDSEAQTLLHFAAVAGQHHSSRLAAKALGWSALAVATASDRLENARLWRNQRFAHDLLLETSYASLSPNMRRLRHTQVLKGLEGSASAGVLAFHAVAAGEDEATVQYSLQAALEARPLAAWSQAQTYLEQALSALQKLSPQPQLEGQIWLELEEVHYRTSQRRAQDQALTKLTQLAVQHPLLASELAYRQGRRCQRNGEFEAAAQHYRQSQQQSAKLALVYVLEILGTLEGASELALQVLQQPDTPENALEAALLLAELAFESGDPTTAQHWYAQAEPWATQPLGQVRFCRSKARFLYHTNDSRGAVEVGLRGIALAQEYALPADEAPLTHNLAVAYNALHQTRQALQTFQKAEALAQQMGMAFLQQSARTQQGLLNIRLGNFEAALALIGGSPYSDRYRQMLLALAWVHAGQASQAQPLIEAVVQQPTPQIWGQTEALLVMGLVQIALGHPKQSEQTLRQALKPHSKGWELGRSWLAYSLLQQQRLDEALEQSQLAYAPYPQIQSDLPNQQIAWIHAQILQALGQDEAAQAALQAAHNELQRGLSDLEPAQQSVYLQAFAYNQAILQAVQGQWPPAPRLL